MVCYGKMQKRLSYITNGTVQEETSNRRNNNCAKTASKCYRS